jgi:hypothetical protein
MRQPAVRAGLADVVSPLKELNMKHLSLMAVLALTAYGTPDQKGAEVAKNATDPKA